MANVSNEVLDTLIVSLDQYKKAGIIDPWVFEDGSIVEPLDVLRELKELRENSNHGDSPEPEKQQADSAKPQDTEAVRGQQSESESVAD